MGGKKLVPDSSGLWELTRKQHGVVARSQLLKLGFNARSIQHRIERGRLHRLWRGVYAVGRLEVGQHGKWMAAVLSCGDEALLSHRSAATLWGVGRGVSVIEIVVPGNTFRRRPGIRLHQRVDLGSEHRRNVEGIPVTDIVSTLVDVASCVPEWQLERAVNEADRLDLIDPESLRAAIEPLPRRPGRARLRALLDRYRRTDSGLERRFLRIARSAGLPAPKTQAVVNGFRVDFHWPDLGLVVESDGWLYHRTPAEQASDQRRDQAHIASGLTPLRFSEEQIRHEPNEVRSALAAVAARLATTRRRYAGLRPETRRL